MFCGAFVWRRPDVIEPVGRGLEAVHRLWLFKKWRQPDINYQPSSCKDRVFFGGIFLFCGAFLNCRRSPSPALGCFRLDLPTLEKATLVGWVRPPPWQTLAARRNNKRIGFFCLPNAVSSGNNATRAAIEHRSHSKSASMARMERRHTHENLFWVYCRGEAFILGCRQENCEPALGNGA